MQQSKSFKNDFLYNIPLWIVYSTTLFADLLCFIRIFKKNSFLDEILISSTKVLLTTSIFII